MVEFALSSGVFALNDLTIVRDGVTQSFDTMADRAGLVAMARGGSGLATPAAFTGDGRGGYSAVVPAAGGSSSRARRCRSVRSRSPSARKDPIHPSSAAWFTPMAARRRSRV
ncbi:MAG: hypothetical protein WKG01_19530 [Kofleriaceae bacterium]